MHVEAKKGGIFYPFINKVKMLVHVLYVGELGGKLCPGTTKG